MKKLLIFLLIAFSCSEQEADPYFYVHDALLPYYEEYIAKADDEVIPINFRFEFHSVLGHDGMGAAVHRDYQNGKEEVLITYNFYSWDDHTRRFIIFQELGHALRSMGHVHSDSSIMAKELYPSLSYYRLDARLREKMNEEHFE